MMRNYFEEVKRLFFARWDKGGLWRVSTRSKRRASSPLKPDDDVDGA
jgi:hypothetical protein